MGPKCGAAAADLYRWSFHSRAETPTLRLGYLSWLVLLAGVLFVVRALGKGGTRLEVVTVACVSLLPPVYMPLLQYFHPEDFVATGLALVGAALVLRGRWFSAGCMLGLALLGQQFALLFVIPLVFVAPRPKIVRVVGGIVTSLALVALPLLEMTSGRALTSLVIGTGDFGGSHFSFYGVALHSSIEVVLLRFIAVALCACISLWVRGRSNETALSAVTVLALLSTAVVLRLYFEVSLFGYYLMPISVLLLLLEISLGRIRLTYVVWMGIATWATVGGGLVDHRSFAGIPVGIWQFLIVSVAGCLALRPMLTAMKVDSSMASAP